MTLLFADAWHPLKEKMSNEITVPTVHQKAAQLYINGLTQKEISLSLRLSQSTIHEYLKATNTPIRKSHYVGEKHPNWKGNEVKYFAAHQRVYKARGKAVHCEICGPTCTSLRFEWANVSGNHHDINDYISLCKSCHNKFDLKNIIQNEMKYCGVEQLLLF